MQDNTRRSVFIGNIPYTASEDQLQVPFLHLLLPPFSCAGLHILCARPRLACRLAIPLRIRSFQCKLSPPSVTLLLGQEVFETAGPVVSLRIQRDKDTGAPKGFGFCEFRDAECADLAIRILTNYEMNGRLLSVDHAHGNLDKSSAGPSVARLAERGQQVAHADGDKHADAVGGGGMGEMTSTLNNMTARQMYELIGDLRGKVENKEQAKALMTQNHLLCCEFLRMQERLGMLTAINLPAPPARAPPQNVAPVLLPIEQVPHAQKPAPAPGMGWNVPQVAPPLQMNNRPPTMHGNGGEAPLQQHAPAYDPRNAHGGGGMAGPPQGGHAAPQVVLPPGAGPPGMMGGGGSHAPPAPYYQVCLLI